MQGIEKRFFARIQGIKRTVPLIHLHRYCRMNQFRLSFTIFLLSEAIFLLFSHMPESFVLIALKLSFGLLAIVIMPGAFLAYQFLPKKAINIGTSFVLGLLFQVLSIQILYTASLLCGWSIELLYWTAFATFVGVTLSGISLRKRDSKDILEIIFGWRYGRWLAAILVCSLVIRFSLFSLADAHLAPDASLYATYAREIVNGIFKSPILNESGVFLLSPSVDFVTHHAFTYIFAISWLIITPASQGPTFILMLIGVFVIFFGFLLCDAAFGRRAGIGIAAILSTHPLFVFHSVVGYGPEITTLLFLAFIGFLIQVGFQRSVRVGFLTGVAIGFVDLIWYANFFALALILPAVFIFKNQIYGESTLRVSILLPLALLARLFYLNLLVFCSIWILTIGLYIIGRRKYPADSNRSEMALLFGILISTEFWYWPLQVNNEIHASFMTPDLLGIGSASGMLLHKASQLIPFLFLHITPVIFCLILISILKGPRTKMSWLFAVVGLIATAGTLVVMGRIPGSLDPIYFFSDSRFFLLPVMSFILIIGEMLAPTDERDSLNNVRIHWGDSKRILLVGGLIFLGLVPSYMAIPSGLALINMEERYGWNALPSIINALGNDDTVFLVNRVREFSWLTNRKCAFLEFSCEGLSYLNATLEMASLATKFSAQFLLIDDYTIAKWKTLEFLLYDPISVGETINLNATFIDELAG
ncbi:MAG: hypothetical protein ACFFER_04560, partial [Candidatus Thorarchaeota archaeon]